MKEKEKDELHRLFDQALHVIAVEEILGLREARKAKEILGRVKLSSSQKKALSLYANLTAQGVLVEYLENHPEVLDLILKGSHDERESIQRIFDGEENRLLGKTWCLERLQGLPEAVYKPLLFRILEQQEAFFKSNDLTPDKLNLFTASLGMTNAEMWGQAEEMRIYYDPCRQPISQEEASPILEFCNELRTALGLAPLK